MVDWSDLSRALGSLGLVLAILWVGTWAIRRFRLVPGMQLAKKGVPPRVSIVSRTAIDPKHTLIMVRRDLYEHLILIGPEGMLVIEQNIINGEKE